MVGSKVKKVLILWYQEGDNFGDVLLYRTSRDFFLKKGIEVDSYEVGEPCIEIIEEANNHDFLLFAGGGIVERGLPNVIRHFKEDYEFLKVPYGVVGLGVSVFDYSNYAEQIEFWINNAEFFYVRDSYSQRRLHEYTISGKVKLSADCVFYNSEILKFGCHIENKVGINLRDLPFKDLMKDFDADVLNKLNTKCDISIVIPDSSDEQWKKIRNIGNIDVLKCYPFLDRGEKIEVTINEIRRCKYLVAMRFHIILVAAVLGVIPIPIVYHQKVKSLVTDLGIDELAVELDELNKIPEKIEKAREKQKYYIDIIARNVERLREKSSNMYSYLNDYFS
ncbi:polysaccharide pyruvyl transferase family protein [Butyrivibrio sp. XBB1001]|uniref:polysaccharide pyruvyl transferase family protein n=1 Tax=Butyrivibrio sp. XBB1001 TaxID=1280682 RepID=UPI000414C11C|nr:polysaccharide pyruvyl transferase family protein [Butyrivibrio sp. XBB1001]